MLLKPYRVLDLTQQDGTLCAQIFADLGAEVVQIEPPGGARGRRLAPFHADNRDIESSLFWWAYSRGKRSLVLDIEQERDKFHELVRRADFLVESVAVTDRERLGLDDAKLRELNPGIIHVSMTPYGPTGPKSAWLGSDLTLAANAGPLSTTGDEDRPPIRVTAPQVWNHAAAEAASAALVALHERASSGFGQHVEVSAQQAFTLATQGNILSAAIGEETVERIAGGLKTGDIRLQLTYPALDGFVSITHIFGATVGPVTQRLMEYVYDEGFCDAATRDKDWVGYGMLLATGEEPIAEFERVKQCVAACTASKTRDELLTAATERRLLLAPMTTIKDVVESPQFADRNFFTRPNGAAASAQFQYPGPFAKFSATPLAVTQAPPKLGEHSQQVLDEWLSSAAISPTVSSQSTGLPLAGVKVLDFMWALAGPGATRMLADHGATIIRVESSSRLDVCRTIRPFIDGDPAPDKSAVFHTTNAGKRLISLDLTKPEAKEVIYDLVRWADVVTESFSPRAMEAFGFSYEKLNTINPKLIMLSTCLMGQTGPLAMFAGYGNLAAAIAGFYEITGWPDRAPAGPFGAYTDYIAPRYNAAAVLAALDHLRRTGEGQHIDLSQAEAAMHFLTPAILDYTVNGRVQSRLGNRDLNWAPHGVYPTQGDDQHIAIACETDEQWQTLAQVLGEPVENATGYATTELRMAAQDALDELIASVTAEMMGSDLEAKLQSLGVPAAMVQNSPELVKDPQLLHQGHFIPLPHHEGGETVIESARHSLSRSTRHVDSSAPTFNRDMMYVLQELLGYDDAKVGELLVAEVLQ